MKKSESIKNVAGALLLFQTKMEAIGKDSTNPFYKSKYCSLSNILENIQLPLAEVGLCFSQLPDENSLTTILIHAESGEYLEASYVMPVAKQNDPQAVGSSITYARRYALGAILGLNIEEDDDANKATVKAEPKSDKAWLNKGTDEWKNAVNALLKGTHTIDDVKKKYALSKPNESELLELTKKNIK
jgi:hypothetical protein